MARSTGRLGALVIGLAVALAFASSYFSRFEAGSTASAAEALDLFLDVGTDADFDPAGPLYLSPAPSGRWQGYTVGENPDLPEGIEPYTQKRFGEPGWIWSRACMGDFYGDFYASAARISGDAASGNRETLHLAVRYKDMTVSPELDIAYGTSRHPHEGSSTGLFALAGPNGKAVPGETYVRLGEMGGSNDRRWKTALYEIPPGAIKPDDRGRYVFSIGFPAAYGRSSLYGDLRVDWIRLSNQPIEPEPDRDGFWPEAPSRFRGRIAEEGFFDAGKPFFPVMLYVNDGESSSAENSFAFWKRTGFNTILYHENGQGLNKAARTYWGSRDTIEYRGKLYRGAKEFFDECRAHGLKAVISIAGSMQRYTLIRAVGAASAPWSQDPLGGRGWRAPEGDFVTMADQVLKAIQAYAKDPAYFGTILKDEIDHPDPSWGSPPEAIRSLYARARAIEPDHPLWITHMGYRRLFSLHANAVDDGILSFDRYPNGKSMPYAEIGQWMEEFKRLHPETALLPIHRIFLREVEPVEPRVRTVTWIGLIHGARGLAYFVFGPDSSDEPEWWAAFGGMLNEVHAVTPALHPATSVELGSAWADTTDIVHYPYRAASTGALRVDNPNIDAVLRRGADGTLYLIAINVRDSPADVRFEIEDAAEGAQVESMFESRTLAIAQGAIVDRFEPYQHRAYRWTNGRPAANRARVRPLALGAR